MLSRWWFVSSLFVILFMWAVVRVMLGMRFSFFMKWAALFSIFIRFWILRKVWSFFMYSSAVRG